MTNPCNCPPNNNSTCLGTNFGVSLAQPQCQLLPDITRTTNPYYDSNNNISFYSYEVLINCGDFPNIGEPGNLVFFWVAICENIPIESVIGAYLYLDSCSLPIKLTYEFNDTQNPPEGFRYLRIDAQQFVTSGSCGVFQIVLSGNYPEASPTGNYFFTTLTNIFTGYTGEFNGFTLPSCPAIPRLSLTKNCTPIISDNTALLQYNIVLANTGEVDLDNVEYIDILNYDGTNITLGEITVEPDTITVDTSLLGVVQFSDRFGTITAGNAIDISYNIPIESFNSQGTYTFSNMANARSGVTEGAAECNLNIDVVAISTGSCCILDVPNATFVFSAENLQGSPNTEITLVSQIVIPTDIVVQFTGFTDCTARFQNGSLVPLDTDITNETIFLECTSLITENSTVSFTADFIFIAINRFSETPFPMVGSIIAGMLVNSDSQILLELTPLPNSSTIDIGSLVQCLVSN